VQPVTLDAAGGAGPQPQLGPLLAGRLAALAAMRRLRRSSVGESPDVPAACGPASNLLSSRRGSSSSKPVSVLAALGPTAAGRAPAAAAADRGGVLRSSHGSSAEEVPVQGTGVKAAAAAGSSRAAAGTAGPARQGSSLQQQQQQQQLDQGPLAKQLSAHAQRWHQQQQQVPSRRHSSTGADNSWAAAGAAAGSTGSVQHSTHSRGSTEPSQPLHHTLGTQASALLQRLLYGEGSEEMSQYDAAGGSVGGSLRSHRSSSGSRG
jgi:hypothetical protein